MKTSVFKTVLRLAVFATTLFSLDTTLKAKDPDYSPLLTDGKVWIYEQPAIFYGWNDNDIIVLRMSITVGEDIEYKGKKGKRVHIDCIDTDRPEYIPGVGSYDLYEIDRVVYCHSEYDKWIYLLPFNLEPGEKAHIHDSEGTQYGSWPISVRSKDSFSLNGRTYKRWITDTKLSYSDPDTGDVFEINDIFIEGIGNIFGIYLYYHFELPESINYFEPRLLEVYENGELIFTYDDFFTGLEDAGISDASVPDIEDNSIYDMFGRKLSQKPEKGIYICNGKKYIAR